MAGGEPVHAPGASQAYTDTGYILLGAMLENLTDMNMAKAVRVHSGYGALALHNTWWEVFEAPPIAALARAKQYYGGFDGDDFGIEPFDLYGGGGMISSAADLAHYFWGLFHGQVFTANSTLELMTSEIRLSAGQPSAGGLPLRHGLQAQVIEGEVLYGHSGWWGVTVYYCPQLDFLVTVNWLQQLAGETMMETSRSIVAATMREIQAMRDPGDKRNWNRGMR